MPTLRVFGFLVLLCGCASTVSGSNGHRDAGMDTVPATDATVMVMDTVFNDTGAEDLPSSVDLGPPPDVAAPRPVAPLSTATTTSQQPTLHWQLATGSDGALIQICADRTCTMLEQTLMATGSSALPATPLSAGVHFWRVYGRQGMRTGSVASPTWEFFVGHRSAPIDTSWGSTLDVNGDGHTDLVVGDPGEFMAGTGIAIVPAATYLYLGSASGVSTSPISLPSPPGNDRFGWSVASAGDVNGDGYADLVVGAPNSSTAYLYLGNATGVAVSPIVLSGTPGSTLGGAVASAGDVNGDGYADLLVGVANDLANTVYLYLGSASGPNTTPSTTLTGVAGTGFGSVVTGAGDLNGDGYADIALGNTADNPAYNAVYVYLGSASGPSTTPITLTDPPAIVRFGNSVSGGGDLNGDGYADLVVGAVEPGPSTDSMYVFLGSAGGLALTPTNRGIARGNSNALSVLCAGDVNGDGYADIAVGVSVPFGLNPSTFSLYLGGTGGPGSTPIPVPVSATAPEARTMAGVGDLNGDGYADLAVGYANNTTTIYPGNASGVGPAMTTLTVDPASYFGQSVASTRETASEADWLATSHLNEGDRASNGPWPSSRLGPVPGSASHTL